MKTSAKQILFLLSGLMLAFIIITAVFYGNSKSVTVPVISERVLVPGGQSVGVKMDVRGVLVVGLEEIKTKGGEDVNPGLLSGLQIGDMIIAVNGKNVYRASEVQQLVNEIKGPVKLKIKRNEEIIKTEIDPVVAKEDDMYKLGIWIKDKTAGIGTLTYYDPSTGAFGALGHGITDPETKSILSVDTGMLLQSQVQEVREGKNGDPGEIKGLFYHSDEPLGNLEKNCEYGVFGYAYHHIENPIYKRPLTVGNRKQVELGKAYILTTLSDNKIERYEIKIEKIDGQDSPADKSMVIKVTDKRLLKESGGIVQGMSGSPIIQNDRIIGAVTHVFVNDPRRGYGIFIEWMLDVSDNVDK